MSTNHRALPQHIVDWFTITIYNNNNNDLASSSDMCVDVLYQDQRNWDSPDIDGIRGIGIPLIQLYRGGIGIPQILMVLEELGFP